MSTILINTPFNEVVKIQFLNQNKIERLQEKVGVKEIIPKSFLKEKRSELINNEVIGHYYNNGSGFLYSNIDDYFKVNNLNIRKFYISQAKDLSWLYFFEFTPPYGDSLMKNPNLIESNVIDLSNHKIWEVIDKEGYFLKEENSRLILWFNDFEALKEYEKIIILNE